jgi:hypothetical protein
MNRNRVLVLTLAIFLILACSMTGGTPTSAPAVPPADTIVPTAAQELLGTFVAQTVEAQQPAATDTPVPVEATPTTAAPALPNSPLNFYVDATCTKVVAHSYTVYNYVFVANMHWDDRSDNETGFEITKDGNPLATLDANTTEYKDTFNITTPYKRYSANVTYAIQTINEAGTSEAVEASVTITCR